MKSPIQISVPDFDDKDLGMITIAVISIFAMFCIPDPTTIVSSAITGIAGFVVGRQKEPTK